MKINVISVIACYPGKPLQCKSVITAQGKSILQNPNVEQLITVASYNYK